MTTLNEKSPVGAFVQDNYMTSEVFRKHGIDFCCQGKVTLEDACARRGLRPAQLLEEINQSPPAASSDINRPEQWPLDFLADYIEKTHHQYVESRIPVIRDNLNLLVLKHASRYPELVAIRDLFVEGARVLAAHMKKEELMLFPAVRKLVSIGPDFDPTHPLAQRVDGAISVMEDEHSQEGERFQKINSLTHGYAPPAGACSTHQMTLKMLHDFESDLHRHIHLENNILFPAVIRMIQNETLPI